MKSNLIYSKICNVLPGKKLLFLFFCTIILGSCGEPTTKDQSSDPAPYPTVKVDKRSVEEVVSYPAGIEGVVNSQVRAKVAGYILQVLVDEGQAVKRGQPLFKLETQSLSRDADAAKSRIRIAQVEVEKLEPLVAQDIISPVQLETAKANLEQAESNYQSILANIGYSNIHSPVDGVVGTIPYRAGNLVSAQDAVPLTTVSKIDKVYAYFSMNEKDFISFIRERKSERFDAMATTLPPVQLQLADGSVYEHEGTIETISGSVDPNSGTVRFRATFPNPEGLLRNGSSGTIRLTKKLEDVLVVPTLSTFEQQGKTFVYLVENDSLNAKSIDVQAETQGLTVLQGLNVGDQILAKGIGKVGPGTRIIPKLTVIDSIVQSFNQVFN
jgi:membrane fusion protein (multidrug efflux system)